MANISQAYYDQLAKVESNNNPFAKAKTSSASGLFQFTKGTWENLGFDWDDRFNVEKQREAISSLTTSNASILSNKGVSVDSGSLYAAHFLGAGTAAKVYNADGSQDLSSIVGSSVITANSFLKGFTVDDFKAWTNKKMGSATSILDSGGTLLGKGIDAVVKAGADAVAVVTGQPTKEGEVADNTQKESGNIFSWIKEFFSANTAARGVAVLIGIGLVILAIWALIQGSKDTIINTALKAAGNAT